MNNNQYIYLARKLLIFQIAVNIVLYEEWHKNEIKMIHIYERIKLKKVHK